MKIILIAFSLLFTLEIGLQSKNLLSNYIESTQFKLIDSDSFNILIIGDSVSDSYKKKLQLKLSAKYPSQNIQILDHILPSVRLVEVYSNINEILKKNNPRIVLTMLGKGDTTKAKKVAIATDNKDLLDHIILYQVTKNVLTNFITEYSSNEKKSEIESNDPIFEKVKDKVGKDLLLAGRFKEAEAHFKLKVLTHPKSFESHSILAEIYMKQNEFKKAKQHLLKLIKLDPQDPPTYGALAYVLRSLKEYDQAKLLLSNAYEKFPNSPSLLKQIIEHNMTLGDFHEFHRYTLLLKEIRGFEAEVKNYEGLYYYHKKDYLKAIDAFNESKKLKHPNLEYVTINLAHAYVGAGKSKLALKNYKEALLLDIYNNNKHFNFLMRSIHYDQFESAKSFYLDYILKKYPGDIRFYVPLSRVYLEDGNYKESYKFLNIYLKKHPTNLEAIKTLATLKSKTNNLADIGIEPQEIKFDRDNNYTRDYAIFYPKVSESIINFGAKHIILQYPDHPIKELEEISFPRNENIIKLDNYGYFTNNYPMEKITDLFVWDNIHLSDKGTSLLVEHIVEKIESNNFIEKLNLSN